MNSVKSDEYTLIREFVDIRKTGVSRKEVLKILHTTDDRIKRAFMKFPGIHKEYEEATKAGLCKPFYHKQRAEHKRKLMIFMERFRQGGTRDSILKDLHMSSIALFKTLALFPDIEKEYKELAEYRVKHSGSTYTKEEEKQVLEKFVQARKNGYLASQAYKAAKTTVKTITRLFKEYPEVKKDYDLFIKENKELFKSPKSGINGRVSNDISTYVDDAIKVAKNCASMSLIPALRKEHLSAQKFKEVLSKYKDVEELYLKSKKECVESKPKGTRHFSRETLNMVKEEYNRGVALSTLAKQLKVTSTVLKRELESIGFVERTQEEINTIQGLKKCPIKTDDEWLEVYEYYKKYKNLGKVNKKFHTSDTVVKRNFKRLGLPLFRRVYYKTFKTNFGDKKWYDIEFWQEMYKFYLENTLRETEREYGISQVRIKSILELHGWKIRSKGEEVERVISEKGAKSFEELKKSLEEYEILGDFKGYTKKGKYIPYTFKHTKCGREFKRTLVNLSTLRCYHCYPPSKREKDIFKLISSHVETLRNKRDIIPPQELDIYIPSMSIAIEYNGMLWHSEKFVDKDYHVKKTEKCLEKGIKLIHFWEWQKEEIVESRVRQILGKSEKIGARNTKLVKVDAKTRKEFFENNHISGDTQANFALGLVKNDILVACMSFRKHKEGIELARFACKLDTTVTGGFSKLLKHSTEHIQEQLPPVKKIITYCNRDWTPDYKDSVYYKNGFNFIKNTGSILSYYNRTTGKMESREKYQKHKLKKIFEDYSDENVNDFLKSKNIFRLYNSGNWKFEKEIV